MDITLIRTFLDVAATGSFVNAADRLFVTQSAVSLRIRRLEDTLGKTLFLRSKAGAELTPAGREFERYALSLLKIWEEARQQIGVPEGFTQSLTLGAQYSLWPRLGFRWIDGLRAAAPTLSLRAELGMPDRLTRFLVEGVVQGALVYTPQLRPGLTARKLIDEDLVLVASWPADLPRIATDYIFVDWGPEFQHAHTLALPDLTNPGLTFALGAMARDYLLSRRAAAYLPARAIAGDLAAGRLHLVPDAPRFPYPVWVLWRQDVPEPLRALADTTLDTVIAQVDATQDTVLEELAGISTAPPAAPPDR
jgi:DNA-binding transcriptional LysR family regulator